MASKADGAYDLALLRQAAIDLSWAMLSLSNAKWRTRRREVWPLMQSLQRADRYLASAQRLIEIARMR